MAGRHARVPEAPQQEMQRWENPFDAQQVLALPLTRTNFLYDYGRGDTNPIITASTEYGNVAVPAGTLIYESVFDNDAQGNRIPDGRGSFQKTSIATGYVNQESHYQTFGESDKDEHGQLRVPEVVTERMKSLQDRMHSEYTDALLDRIKESQGVTNRPEHEKYLSSVALNEVLSRQDEDIRIAASQLTEPVSTIGSQQSIPRLSEPSHAELPTEVPVTEKESPASLIPVHMQNRLQDLRDARTIGQPKGSELPNLGGLNAQTEVVTPAANQSRLDRLRTQIANKRTKDAIVSGVRPERAEPTVAEKQRDQLAAKRFRRQVQEHDTLYSQTPAEAAAALAVLRTSSDVQAELSDSQHQVAASSSLEPHASMKAQPRHRKQKTQKVVSTHPGDGARSSHRGPARGLFKRSRTAGRHSRI